MFNEFEDIIGIFQGDLIIKTAIELSLSDMRQKPWLIHDTFRSLQENPILKQKYGLKEINRAQEFILNNEIPVYMRHRLDKMEYPCITISMGPSNEDKELATLGDTSPCVEEYTPAEIGKPLAYIIPPFQYESYDSNQGLVKVPDSIEEVKYISKNMVLVDPETGNGFIIDSITGNNEIKISPGSTLPNGKVGVVPAIPLWKARRERAISQEQYNIGCHVDGDPSYLIFLYGVVKYALYRYREGLLESNNFQLSRLSSTDLIRNENLDIENGYSRWITLSGQVEESWVKAPKRYIEAMDLACSSDPDAPEGIKIISSKRQKGVDEQNTVWTTIDDKDAE